MAWTKKRKFKKGIRYTGCFRDADGVERSAGTSSDRKAALAEAVAEERKVALGTWKDPDAPSMTLDEYFTDHWMPARGREQHTRDQYESVYRLHIKPRFGATPLRQIKRRDVQRWIADLSVKGVRPPTVKRAHLTLQVILAGRYGVSALSDEYIDANPCTRMTLPTVPKREVDIYTPEEADKLLDALDPWYRLLVLLMIDTGVRWGEAAGLQARDVIGTHLHVRRTITLTTKGMQVKPYPKGKKPRRIGMGPELIQALREHTMARGLRGDDFLFSCEAGKGRGGMPDRGLGIVDRTELWPGGRPIDGNRFRARVYLPAITKAKIPRRRIHDLRATNISWLLAGGLDLASVMERSGHTQIETVQRYVKALPDVDERAQEALARVRSASA